MQKLDYPVEFEVADAAEAVEVRTLINAILATVAGHKKPMAATAIGHAMAIVSAAAPNKVHELDAFLFAFRTHLQPMLIENIKRAWPLVNRGDEGTTLPEMCI